MTICFIIGLVVINFGLFFHNRLSLMKSLETKKEIELVENSINRLWSLVQLADLGIRGYLLIPEKQMLSPFDEAITQYPWKPF